MSQLRTPPEQAVVVRAGPAPRAKESARLAASPRGTFLAAMTVLYASAILLTTLTLNPYFAQTWDVTTFLHAAHRFLDGGTPFDLYAQSRAAQAWPYAYPPLHALMVAVALLFGKLLPALPEYVWARLPATLADIAIAFVLYGLVERRTEDRALARIAALVWLFNPVTFYDTAVQGHFESEWLLFVLLAYVWYEEGWSFGWSTLALAIAVLFKQVAILFAIPFWVMLIAKAGDEEERSPAVSAKKLGRRGTFGGERSLLVRRMVRLAASLLVFAIVVGVVCLPFLLYSNDFVYMNLTYVENMPVQTSSWLVGVLGLTRAAPDALTSDFPLLRLNTMVTALAALAIALVAARKGWSLYVAATLIALAFFLTSRKVMGYYFVMLLPFLLAAELPGRRFRLVTLAAAATAWMALSPYYAAWTDHSHWWVYALLGILNSLFFAWLFVQVISRPTGADGNPEAALVVSAGLFLTAVVAALLQPLVSSAVSPIRSPLIPPGMEGNALLALFLLVLFLVGAVWLAHRWLPRAGIAAWGSLFIFAPLLFAVYTLTKESTAILEMALTIAAMAPAIGTMALKALGG